MRANAIRDASSRGPRTAKARLDQSGIDGVVDSADQDVDERVGPAARAGAK